MMVSSAFLTAALALLVQADPNAEHEHLRARVAQALRSLEQPPGFDVHYSTFEVLTASELGSELRPLLAPSSAVGLRGETVADRLATAAKATGRSVPEQLDQLSRERVPEHARASGLLLGGGPMLFQVRRGETLVSQACLSDPAHFSIVRTPEYDVVYFSEQSRLEIAPRNDGIMLFTPAEYCLPLPVSVAGVQALTGAAWQVSTISEGFTELRVQPGSETGPVLTLVMGGPGGGFPLYGSRRPSASDDHHALVTRFDWTFEGDRGVLQSVLHLQWSPEQVAVVHYRFGNRRPSVTDADCVLLVGPLRTLVDRRAGTVRHLKTDSIPGEVAKLLVKSE